MGSGSKGSTNVEFIVTVLYFSSFNCNDIPHKYQGTVDLCTCLSILVMSFVLCFDKVVVFYKGKAIMKRNTSIGCTEERR